MEFLGLAKSFLHTPSPGQKSKDTKPSSEAKISAAAESFKEMLILSPEWTLV